MLSLSVLRFFCPSHRFVEIMAPVFSREAWRCVWHMIQVCVQLSSFVRVFVNDKSSLTFEVEDLKNVFVEE